ncbi:MAG: glycosyltransferase family 2 protein [Flavobacteriaceae bacterium]
MVSILIPVYNYSIKTLVCFLHNQAIKCHFPFEILVFDDASTLPFPENESITQLPNCFYERSKENIGRTEARNQLAKKAKYDYALFLDADVMPQKDTFLEEFIDAVAKHPDIIFGGITYENATPTKDRLLRWYYGKKRESLPLKSRKKEPYLSINSGCFLIKKSLFLSLSRRLNFPLYGLDLYFKILLAEKNAVVTHIDNPVYHLGIETSKDFLEKSLRSIETLFFLEKNNYIEENSFPIQRAFHHLKKIHLIFLFQGFFNVFYKFIEYNLLSKRPILFLFDVFRLNHFIRLKNGK